MKKLLLGLLLCLLTLPLLSQERVKIVYLDDPVYEYLDYRINAGGHIPHFLFQQPYNLDSTLFDGSDLPAGRYFQRYWSWFYGDKQLSVQLHLGDKLIYDETLENRARIAGGIHFAAPYITLGNRTVVDGDFKRDPHFAGDLSEANDWIFGRVNDAYINLNYRRFGLFFGRINRNWGPPDAPSLILSDHPYSYDHLLFSYSANTVKLSLIFAQLEDLPGLSIDDPRNTDSVTVHQTAHKYLVGHRLDIRFSRRLQIALTEMATYGGPGRNVDLLFFNPVNFYYAIQRNDQRQMNGLWALDAFYKPRFPAALYFQFLLDDIVINNDKPDERERFPDRFGLQASIRSADLLRGLNAALTYVRIWNRTYQSRRNWENYHFRELSLGYPCASCEEVKLKLGYWGAFPLVFQNETIIGRYGDAALTDLFLLTKETFPVPPVTHNFVNYLTVRYLPHPKLNIFARVHYLKEPNHYSNRIDGRDGLFFFLGAEINLRAGFEVD